MSVFNFLKIIVLLFSVCLLGFCVNALIYRVCGGRGEYKISLSGLPLFFILGAGAYVFYGMFFSIAGIKSGLAGFLFLVIIGASIFVLIRNSSLRVPPPSVAGRSNLPAQRLFRFAFSGLILFLIILPLAINLLLAMSFPQFDIDMLGHILVKAKLLTAGTYKDCVFMHDDLFSNINNRYPPFVGIFYGLLFLLRCNTISCYQVVNYFIFLLVGVAVYSYLKGLIPLWQSLCWFFIFISTGQYISSQFIMDSTDVLLSLNFILAALCLINYCKQQSLYNLILCAVLAGIAALIKNEGLIFGIVAGILLFVKFRLKTALKYLLIWAIIALPWILYSRSLPDAALLPEQLIKTAKIPAALQFLPQIAAVAFNIAATKWNSFFIFFIPAIIILAGGNYKKEAVVFSSFTLSLFLVYFVMIWLNIGRAAFYANSFIRILSHLYPMVAISVALATGQLMRKDRNKSFTG